MHIMPSVEHLPEAAPSRTSRPLAGHRTLGLARLLPVTALLAAIVALSFLSGGYIFDRTAPVVFVLVPFAIAWIWTAPRRQRLGWPAIVGLTAFALFAVWEGLSIAWSLGPDLSWLAFDVTLLYMVVAVVVTAAPAGPVQLRVAGYGYVCVMVPLAAYAFLGKVLPEVVTNAHLYARLSSPIGYWNVLAIMLVMATVPALEGASRNSLPIAARGVLCGALGLFLFTLFFTFSRGGTLALALALVVYFALTNERLQGALTLALTAVPVGAALYHVRHLGTLFDATANDALRTTQGHIFGRWALAAILLAACAQTVAALVARRIRLTGGARRIAGAVVLAVAVAAVVTGLFSFASRYGGFGGFVRHSLDQLTSSSTTGSAVGNGASRLLDLGNDSRVALAREGLDSFSHHPLFGTGAGTFQFTNALYRSDASIVVMHAHNQWINVLSELGLVGLALFVVALGGLLVAALRPVGRGARDSDRGLLAALQAAAVAFVAHMTIDWDWDMAAAALVFLLFVGVAAAYVRRRDDLNEVGPLAPVEPTNVARGGSAGFTFGRASRAFATGALVLVALSWFVPYASDRAYSRALLLAAESRTTPAIVQARMAHRLDPLAVQPLFTLAELEQQQGKMNAALAALQQAVKLQPQNYSTYYELGLMQLNVLDLNSKAAASFRRALSLNPLDPNSNFELSEALAPTQAP